MMVFTVDEVKSIESSKFIKANRVKTVDSTMARFINFKLLIVLTIVGGITVAGAAIAWVIAGQTRATQALHDGDAAMAAGSYESAQHLYGKALRHARYREDTGLMIKMSEVITRLPVSDDRDATTHIDSAAYWLRRANRLNPHDETAFQLLMHILMRRGLELRDRNAWDLMYADTQQLLESYPNLPVATKYRGISQIRRLELAETNLTPQERQQAEADFRSTLKSIPEDAEAIHHLARWLTVEAARLDTLGGSPDAAQALRNEAVRLGAESSARHPNDTARLIDHADILDQLDRRDELEAVLNQIETAIPKRPPPPHRTVQAVSILLRFHTDEYAARPGTEILKRCSELVRAVMTRPADEPNLAVALVMLYQYQRKFEEAKALSDQVWQAPRQSNPMDFLARYAAAAAAGQFYIDIGLRQVQALGSSAEREPPLEDVETRLKQYQEEFRGTVDVNELAARVAAARGQWVKASIELDLLTDRTGGRDTYTLYRAAESLANAGELGAAAEHCVRALAVNPDLTLHRHLLAKLYMRAGSLELANEQIAILRQTEPDAESNLQLQLEMMVRQKKFVEADQLLEQVAIEDDPGLCLVLADLYQGADRIDQCRSLLVNAFRANPANLRVLTWLLHVTDDEAAQLALIDEARSTSIASTELDRLAMFVRGELDVEEKLAIGKKVGVGNSDPTVRASIDRCTALIKDGNREGALGELAKLDRNETGQIVAIWNLFQTALEAGDWETAEVLLTPAREVRDGRGADLAQGFFYTGQLQMQQGNFDRAIDNFHEALSIRRVYSDGWRMLGDALLGNRHLNAARDAYETAVQQRPINVLALNGLARVHDLRGEYSAALAILRKAHQTVPDDQRMTEHYLRYELEHGDPETVVSARRQMAQKEPEDLQNRRGLVLALTAQKRFPKAMDELQRLVDEEGSTLSNVITAAEFLAASRGRQIAIKALMQYIQNQGDHATVDDFLLVGRQLWKLGEVKLARHAYRQGMALEDAQRRPVTRELARRLLKSSVDLEEAEKLYGLLWRENKTDPQLLLSYAETLSKNGKWEDTNTLLQDTVADQGYTLSLLRLMARVAARNGDLPRAESLVEQALHKNPKWPPLLLEKAIIMASDPSRIEEVRRLLDKALDGDPTLVEAMKLKARLAADQGEIMTAVREYEGVLRHDPRQEDVRLALASLYVRTDQQRKLEDLVDDSARHFPESTMWKRHQARRAMRDGHVDISLEIMHDAFATERTALVLSELVAFQIKAGREREALDSLRSEINLVKESPILQALRAQALLKLGRHDEAMAVLRSASKGIDDLDDLRLFHTQIATYLDAETVASVIFSATKWPRDIWGQMVLAERETRQGRHKTALARLEPLRPGVAERPEREQIYFYELYSQALRMLNDFPGAAAAYHAILNLDPDHVGAMKSLVALRLKDPSGHEEALTLAQRAAGLRPNDPTVTDMLGLVYLIMGEHQQALETLEASVRQKPMPKNCLHLAAVLLNLKQIDRAEEILDRARHLAEKQGDQATLQAVDKRLQFIEELRTAVP